MARLFVAAWPPEDVVARLRALPRPERPGVRWTTPDQWHVTLRFLGEADPEAVAQRLARAALPMATATLGPRLRTLGRGNVVVPVAGLERLAGAVDAAIDDRPDHPFRGHLTVARVRRGGRPVLVGDPIDGEFAVDEVTLVASTLAPRGARYEVLERWATTGAQE